MIKFHELSASPISFKKATIFLIVGWILHYVIYFKDFMDPSSMRETYLQVGVGLMICYFVINVKSWARMLCIFFNIGIAILYLPICLSYYAKGQSNLSLIAGLVTVSFAFSTYYLLTKETGQFFNAHKSSSPEQTPSSTERH